jgi:hypothetical protein
VIKERTPDAADIVNSSPTVPLDSLEDHTDTGKCRHNLCYSMLFIALIMALILLLKHLVPDLRKKIKTGFAFLRCLYGDGKTDADGMSARLKIMKERS